MKGIKIRRLLAWALIWIMTYGSTFNAVALTLATTPLASSTTSVVRPNLMYVLDDSGSMAWDYTPDYINDATVTDPTNVGLTPPGSSGDTGSVTISGGSITAITAVGGNVYGRGAPTVLIQGDGTGAAATVTLNASTKKIQSVSVTSGGTGYTSANTYVTFLGGLSTAAWGMCWGTTGSSNQGGTPKDTSASPSCTTNSQLPYATAAVNYQYYDPAVRYQAPLKADGSSYAAASTTAAKSDGFAGTGTLNLTTGWTHEIWCNTASPSPTPTAANIATHAQCKENLDTSGNNLYPNAIYSFRKTYNGPAAYYVMDPSEYCTSTDYTNCVSRATALAAIPPYQISGVTFNVPSKYRWCAYYNPVSHTFGGCQGRRDLDHYIPNYLGGWISTTGGAGVHATANLVIKPTTAGQSLSALTVGGVDIVGGTQFTSATNGDQNTIAQNICTAIQANTGSSGYTCASTGNTVVVEASAIGTAANGLQVLASGPPVVAAVNSTGKISVSPGGATIGLSITSITINSNQLISANITATGNENSTARTICEAIVANSGVSGYTARSDLAARISADLTAWGTCVTPDDANVWVQRKQADNVDNGQAIVVTGPAAATVSTGSIQINSTSGSTSISDVTLAGVSIMSPKPLTIADGTQTASIASALATRLNGNGGCTATASGGVVTISGCTGALAVTSSSTQATGVIKVTSTGHTYGADLGGILVGATSIVGHLGSSTLTNGSSVLANANSIRSAINAGTGTHGFSAAAPVASGSDYTITVTAPTGTSYNGTSFVFQDGTASGSATATSPQWNFSVTGASADDALIGYARCGTSAFSTQAMLGSTASTGTTNTSLSRTTNLANGLSSSGINGFTYSCSYVGGTNSNDQTCSVTGPTGVSACTSDLSFTKDSSITLKNYSKTAAVANCPAITAPTWQFQIGSTNAPGGADYYISSIACGSTDTITPNTVHTGTSTTGDTRRTNLGNGLQNNDKNGYTYSCSLSNSKETCTVTGPVAAAACTTLTINANSNISINYNNSVVQTCPAITPTNSATWQFTIDEATTDNRYLNSIVCGGVSTITNNSVNTGTTPSPVVTRINNLVTDLQTNETNNYTFTCSAATSGTPRSDCTVTGPAGPTACVAADNDCPAGSIRISYNNTISLSGGTVAATVSATPPNRYCVPLTSNGQAGGTAIDNFAPYLLSPSSPSFSGGTPSQGTTITQISSTTVGPIATTTTAMSNGTAASVLTIPTNATGVNPDVLTMTGGAAVDTATNHWTGVGILRRIDVTPSNNSYNRASGRTDCVSSTCSYTEELQNFANWYSYYRTRMLMMKSASTLAFSQLDGNYRVGFDNICQATSTTVDNPISQFSGTGRSAWWTSLTSATPSCATPLRTETAKIGRYYAGKLSSADPMEYSCQQNYMLLVTDGYWNEADSTSIKGVSGADVGNTDNVLQTSPGVPSGSVARPYYDGQQASTSCPSLGSTRSAASSCRTLADVTNYFYSTDLRTTAFGNASNGVRDVSLNNVMTTSDDKNQAQHMNFFAMGLGIDGTLAYSSDYQTSGVGDYAAIVAGTKNWPAVANLDPTAVDDLWHATVNGRGKYFSARNVPNVVAGLREALNKIGARVGSAAAAATSNLEPVAGDNFAYVASYTTVDWTGDLQSRSIDVTTGDVSSDTNCGVTGSGCQWSAQTKLDNLVWSSRRIYIAPSSGVSGDPLRAFTYANLSGSEQAYFNPSSLSQYAALSVSNPTDISASNLVDYLRGNKSLEQDGDVSHAQIWRFRPHIFGDIVNTQPVFMKAPSQTYSDGGYSTFKTTSTAASRTPVVFVSAQDGMLHAINAHTATVTVNGGSVQPGEEMWAFIPSQAMQSVKGLGDVNYTHRYFVDGQITVADVDFGSGDWHTILVGGQGSGGTSYYALDVTNPLVPKYLWEFSHANLGYSFSNVTVSKLPTGAWAVLFSSGYNNNSGSGDGAGHIYALNPQTGAIKSGFPLTTGSGTSGNPSNLGKISVWADNPSIDNTAQYIYAGDLNGDLWRFDLDTGAGGHTGVSVFKLAHLENNSIAQPITTKPELTQLSSGTRVVYVGTGKYLETSDLLNVNVQGFYAIKDTLGVANLGSGGQTTWNPATDTVTVSVSGTSTSVPMFLTRSLISTNENHEAITETVSGVTKNVRKICPGASATVTAATPTSDGVCNNADITVMDWSVYGGWYISLPDSGERVNVDPRLVLGTLVFASNIPAADSCTVGGRSWVNVLDYLTGLGVNGATIGSAQIADSLVVGLTVVKLSSGAFKAIATKSNYQQETLDVPVSPSSSGGSGGNSTFGSKRSLWREFEAY